MTTPASNPNKSKTKWKLATFCLILMLVLYAAAVIWGAGAIPSVFGGRYAYRPSPDRDGNVIAELKFAVGPSQTDIKKWTLLIPNKYVDMIVGDLDNVGENEFASLNLIGVLDFTNREGSFPPPKERYGADNSFLNISNKRVPDTLAFNGKCISSANKDDLADNPDLRACEYDTCMIYDDFDGWRVQYQVAQKSAIEPAPVCLIMRDFLNSHTIQRDVIPNRGNN
jgi:hypothetical protein